MSGITDSPSKYSQAKEKAGDTKNILRTSVKLSQTLSCLLQLLHWGLITFYLWFIIFRLSLEKINGFFWRILFQRIYISFVRAICWKLSVLKQFRCFFLSTSLLFCLSPELSLSPIVFSLSIRLSLHPFKSSISWLILNFVCFCFCPDYFVFASSLSFSVCSLSPLMHVLTISYSSYLSVCITLSFVHPSLSLG